LSRNNWRKARCFLKRQPLCYYSEMAILVLEKQAGEALSAASSVIRRGGIAAVPTETFYGLCARYDDPAVLERLYALKGRPRNRAMPLIIGDVGMLGLVAAAVTGPAQRLIGTFWPGPLTLLLDARQNLPQLITAGTGKVAVRVPGASFALDLARSVGIPLTATSANVSGMPPAESAEEVVRHFGDGPDILIDGGKTPGGMPSTLVEVKGGRVKIVRPGKITEEEILRAVD
jgi:L-threonylcarbamoyladenylate synthase